MIIDIQLGFVAGPRPAYRVEELLTVVSDLQRRARAHGAPIVYCQHDGRPGHPTEFGTDGWSFHPRIAPLPGETVVRKQSTDAFHRTDLHEVLTGHGVTEVVTTGFATELCVDTTCRRGITLGYDMTLVSDGHSTQDGGPPEHPAPDVRIKWTNHMLSKVINVDRGIQVRPSEQIVFG